MDEWTKAVITTLLGFIAGLVAEPIKGYLQESHKRKALRRLIYRDLVGLEESMQFLLKYPFESLPDPQNDIHFEGLRTDLFDWAFGSSKETFYRLDEAPLLVFLYRKIRSLAATEPADEASFQQSRAKLEECLRILRDFENFNVLEQGELDLARLKHKEIRTKFAQQRRPTRRSSSLTDRSD